MISLIKISSVDGPRNYEDMADNGNDKLYLIFLCGYFLQWMFYEDGGDLESQNLMLKLQKTLPDLRI